MLFRGFISIFINRNKLRSGVLTLDLVVRFMLYNQDKYIHILRGSHNNITGFMPRLSYAYKTSLLTRVPPRYLRFFDISHCFF